MQIADDFIENVVNASCDIAKHRHSDTLEVKDVQLYLERAWNMWIPGFGSEEIRPYKRAPATEAHRQVRSVFYIFSLSNSLIPSMHRSDAILVRIDHLNNLGGGSVC